jgi:hypothetical protein
VLYVETCRAKCKSSIVLYVNTVEGFVPRPTQGRRIW